MQCLRSLLCSFDLRKFPFSHSLQWAPKYHLAEHKIGELANCSKKGRVELCVMKSNIRKQSLSKLLSSYYLRIFPFSPWSPMGSPISLCRFHKKSVNKLPPENYAVPLWEEFTVTKKFLTKLLSRFELMLFPLSAKASMRSKEVLLRFFKNSDNGLLHVT